MNNLLIFKNETFGEIRSVDYGGKPYFVANDIAKALGYSRPRQAVMDHCKGSIKMALPSEGGIQDTNIIPEGDIYRLIVKSQLPSAEKFELWVFDEVLPSIRQTGGYVSNDDMFINTYLPFADNNTKALFKSTLLIIKKQNEQIEIMQPKSKYFDELVDRNLLTNFRDTAKELGIKEKDFINFLMEHEYVYRDGKGKLKPYAVKNTGLFELKEFASRYSDHAGVQTLITPRGRETFRLLLNGM